MLISDLGICLGYRPFKDNLRILSLISKETGRFNALIRVSKKHPSPPPFSLIAFNYHKKDTGITTIREFEILSNAGVVSTSPVATTTILFLCELFIKTIPEHYSNEELYLLIIHASEKLQQDPGNSFVAVQTSILYLKVLGVLDTANNLHEFNRLTPNSIAYLNDILNNTASDRKLIPSEKKHLIESCIQHLAVHFQSKFDIRSLEYFNIVFQGG